MEERLQKILSKAGVASRRKAEELILAGKVIVNGQKASLGQKASFSDDIWVNNKQIFGEEDKVYYMINKPPKSICSVRDPEGRRTVISLINDSKKLFPVGRLDWNTTGTLLITNDGDLSNKLIHPKYEIIRVYRARINEPLDKKDIDWLNGDEVFIKDKKSVQTVTQADKKTYVISLTQGSYHHVKELFEQVGREVIKLTRIEFAGLSHVQNLSVGQYRELTPGEVNSLKNITEK